MGLLRIYKKFTWVNHGSPAHKMHALQQHFDQLQISANIFFICVNLFKKTLH
jgi:hypothetical protein